MKKPNKKGQQRGEARKLRGRAVRDFFAAMKKSSKTTFHSVELEDWVRKHVPDFTPGCGMRTARQLRSSGIVEFKCVDHPRALYEFKELKLKKSA